MKKIIIILSTSFLMLGVILFSNFQEVKAQEPPSGVDSIERMATFWEHETTSGSQVLFKSNRFYISNSYKYFLFDLKHLVGDSKGGALGSSQGITFFSSHDSTVPTNIINFDDFDFDNFIDMSSYTNRWIEFRLVLTLQGTDTVYSILNYINNNRDYELSILAISGTGIIVKDDLYDYITSYVNSIVSSRIDYAQQVGFDYGYDEGYDDGRADYGQYYPAGSPNGLEGWYNFQDGYDLGRDYGYDDGYDIGYNDGVVEQDTTYKGVFSIITNAIFTPIALVFGIEILPNISLGMIILVPLLFGLIAFVVGGKKK